ncbi:MAG TPA: hypothetical protein VGC44_11985 [Longimicrobiales bacterium]
MQTSCRAELNIAGCRCIVEGAEPHELRWLARHWAFTRQLVKPLPYPILLKFKEEEPRDPSAFGGQAISTSLPGTNLVWADLGGRSWQTGDARTGVRLRIGARAIEITVWRTPSAECTPLVSAALYVALAEALRTNGLLLLHAAVAVHRGRATAFVGHSGVGKTTTLISLIARGWTPVAEDVACYDVASGMISGSDRGVHLAPVALGRQSIARELWCPHSSGKLFLSYADLGTRRMPAAPLQQLVFLRRDASQPTQWREVTRYEAVRGWYEGAGIPMCARNRQAFAARIPKLLDSVATAGLTVGNTPLSFWEDTVNPGIERACDS